MRDVRKELDNLVKTTTLETFNVKVVPRELQSNLDKWHWGSYGWVSPASLIFTATWRKYFYPKEDCCKIWAKDENNNQIPGGYSIRTEDELVTIPILAKYDLCNGFCSPNSGMQGSRAIEKMRALKRLNTDFDNAQRTVFDLKLFAATLNQIDKLNSDQALNVLKYLILIAKAIKERRIHTNEELQNGASKQFNLMTFLAETHDPELTKCVAATCLEFIFFSAGLTLEGVSDFRTAADARAQKPGDLSLSNGNNTVIAVEVKDKTQNIDWNNIDRAKKIILSNDNLKFFIFVLEKKEATVTDVIQEMVNSPQFHITPCNKIIFLSINDLYLLALALYDESKITKRTGQYLSQAPSVKPETKEKWLAAIQ